VTLRLPLSRFIAARLSSSAFLSLPNCKCTCALLLSKTVSMLLSPQCTSKPLVYEAIASRKQNFFLCLRPVFRASFPWFCKPQKHISDNGDVTSKVDRWTTVNPKVSATHVDLMTLGSFDRRLLVYQGVYCGQVHIIFVFRHLVPENCRELFCLRGISF